MVRSSLKEIKKVLRKTYPKPFDVSSRVQTDTSGSANFVVIKDFNKKIIAQFKYVQEDGAILTGFINLPLYKDRYDKIFSTLDINKNLDYHQKVLDLFHENTIFRELFSSNESLKLMEYMIKAEEYVIRRQDLNNDFRKLAPTGLQISMGYQYYINEDHQLKPRIMTNFEFRDFGKLIIYYDYEKNELRFGESQFVDHNSFDRKNGSNTSFLIPSFKQGFSNFFVLDELNYYDKVILKTIGSEEIYQLFGLEKNQEIKTFEQLELIFERWMTEIGVLINQKSAVFYTLDETFEAHSKNNVIENFNLIKMNLI